MNFHQIATKLFCKFSKIILGERKSSNIESVGKYRRFSVRKGFMRKRRRFKTKYFCGRHIYCG